MMGSASTPLKDSGRSERPKKGEGFSVLNSGLESAERIQLHILLNRVAIFAHHMKRPRVEFVPSTCIPGCKDQNAQEH